MSEQSPPTTLLRIAAFVIDSLVLSLLLVLPATIISYGSAWLGTSTRGVNFVWWTAFFILCLGILLRDGFRGRSPGKRLFGLRLVTANGEPCSPFRSALRNLPLVIPGWNLVEVLMVFFAPRSRRCGDLMAKTSVTEE
jgi:uncharacterized RDD family membrane protein YckC